MQSPEYDWRLPPEAAQAGKPWLVEVTDRMLVHVRAFFESIGRGIERFARWLARQLGGGGPEPVGGAPPRSLHWSIYLLTAAVLGAGAWLVWRARGRSPKAEPAADEPVTAVASMPRISRRRACPKSNGSSLPEQCLRDANYRLALRALYLANLAWLGQREFLTLQAARPIGSTKRSCVAAAAHFRKRAPCSPRIS